MNKAHEIARINQDTGEVEEVNNNFVQLYIDKLDLIIEMTSENPTAVKVFTWLLKHMDKRNALVISQQALSEALSISRQTVHTSVRYLKKKKALAIFKSGNTNIYAINAQIAWKSNAFGKRYALFDAKVFISEFEQGDQDKPLFETQLVGHAKVKSKKSRTLKPNAKNFEKEVQGNS